MKRVRIICDLPLLFQAIIATGLMVGGCSWAIWVVGVDGVAKNQTDVLTMQSMFAVLMVGFVVAICLSSPRIFSIITLTEKAVSLWMPFRARETYSYRQFPYVYWGRYFHGNVVGTGCWVWYIIFSTNKLFTKELNQANKLSNSKDLFKIRYSKKTFATLCLVLPPHYRNKLIKDSPFHSTGDGLREP